MELRFSDRASTITAASIFCFVAVISICQSIATPFWYDEVCTVIVCRLPSLSAIWNAFGAAIDTNPPGYYYLARLTRGLVADEHLGYRLPSVVGLLGTLCFLYAALARRIDRLSALCAAAFVLETPLTGFVYQARPYAFMVGCIACGALAWGRLAESKYYSVLLTAALASAVAVHYYAVLALPAFALAEFSVLLLKRQFRLPAWLPICACLIPMLLTRNLLLSLRQYYGHSFWAQPHVLMLFTSHDWLFNTTGRGLAVALFLTFACLWCLKTQAPLAHSSAPLLRVEECVFALALLWLPFLALLVAQLGKGGMTSRYMLPAVLGGAMIVGYLLSRAPASLRAAVLGLLLLVYAYLQMFYFKKVLNVQLGPGAILSGSLMKPRFEAQDQARSLLSKAGSRQQLPIVISSGIEYLPIAFYTPPSLQGTVYAITDPLSALAYSNSDSVDLALIALRSYFPLQVEDFSSFRTKHSTFLLVSSGGQFDWWPSRLLHDGNSLELIAENASERMYRVTMKH